MTTIIKTERSTYRCTRYFDRLAQSDHIMIEKRRTFLGIPIGWRQVDVQEANLEVDTTPVIIDGRVEHWPVMVNGVCESFLLDAKFCVRMYEEGLVTSALLKNL